MKWSKKDEAKWAKKRVDQMTGRTVNATEAEAEKKLRVKDSKK